MSDLNWTIATVVMFITTIPEIVAAIISIRGYVQTKYPHFFYMFFTWFFLWGGNLILAISYLTLDMFVYRIGLLFMVPVSFFIMWMVDSISTEQIDAKKLFIVVIVSCMLVIFAFDENGVAINTSILNERTPSLKGRFNLATSALFILNGVMWNFYMIKLYIFTPQNIRKYAKINLIGALLAGPGAILLFLTGFVWIMPGSDFFLLGIGALLCAYAFTKQKKLGYILPFRVYRLIVVDSRNGVALFTFSWGKSQIVDKTLFSAIVSGITILLKKSLKLWNMQEMKFDKGILILTHEPENPIIFGLITSKSSTVLRHGLETFSINFKQQFKDILKNPSNDLSVFNQAEKIIHKAFPFVVSHDI